MQIQVAGLLQFAVPLFPTAEVRRLPPPGSVPEQGEPQLDPDNPSPLLPLLDPMALQSQAVESAPLPRGLVPLLPLALKASLHTPLSEVL